MKTLMAEEASSKPTGRKPTADIPGRHGAIRTSNDVNPGTQIFPQKSSQLERHKQVPFTIESPPGDHALMHPLRSGGSPWRTPPAQAFNLVDHVPPPLAGIPSTNLPRTKEAITSFSSKPSTDVSSARRSQKLPQSPTQPGLGPTFTPSRQTLNPGSSTRRVSYDYLS